MSTSKKATQAPPTTTTIKKAQTPSGFVQGYLVAYNLVSCVGWSAVLYRTIHYLLQTSGQYEGLYDHLGWFLTLVQTGAVLEVVHSLVGIVRSPVLTTGFQVLSRIFLVWGICHHFPVPEVLRHPAFTTMTLAWSITEAIRYLFYALGLLGTQPRVLLWLRYTLFFILYPLGAGSEAYLVYQSLDAAKALPEPLAQPIYYFLLAVLVIYPPGLAIMYTHMISQRARALGPKRKVKKIE